MGYTVCATPPGCISRGHAAVAFSWHYFVLGSRLAHTCPHRTLAVYSFKYCLTFISTRWLTPLYILIIPSRLVKLVYLL